jgi:hypothetical protein
VCGQCSPDGGSPLGLHRQVFYVQKSVREWPTMIGQPQVGMALAAETRLPQPLYLPSTGAAWPLHTPGLA